MSPVAAATCGSELILCKTAGETVTVEPTLSLEVNVVLVVTTASVFL
jgi:hypothetical protein